MRDMPPGKLTVAGILQAADQRDAMRAFQERMMDAHYAAMHRALTAYCRRPTTLWQRVLNFFTW